MKKHLSTLLLVAVFLLGVCIMLYPTVSDYWNSLHQTRAIGAYEDALAGMTRRDYDAAFQQAEDYNQALAALDAPMSEYQSLSDAGMDYEEILNINGVGIMGYIDINAIGVELPIYHGTSPDVLNVAVGHLEGSSLPIGGEGSHCVLSAHRGLPSARLFTDLDQLQEGDTFTITVLDRLLTYEIDQILIVEPEQVDALAITPGEDYCTLVTCTPYGINTHRLLVRGKRVENAREKAHVYVPADMAQIDPMVVTPAVAAPMLAILLVFLLVRYRKRR
ncbi:MAG: class C sortase [Eubacteriales bacterium]|nr:class C sortase [Eubacteriales bacterium]